MANYVLDAFLSLLTIFNPQITLKPTVTLSFFIDAENHITETVYNLCCTITAADPIAIMT